MSQKKTTTSNSSSNTQRQFDPSGLATYQGLQPGIGNVLSDFMSNPWRSGYFQQQLGRANEMIGQQGRTNLAGVLNLATQGGGVGNMPAFLASEGARVARGTQRNQSNALTNLLLGSSQLRLGAAGQAQGYNPLETGQNSTSNSSSVEKTGGLGSWLPQLIGAGLGMAAGGMGGGGMLGGLFGGGGAAAGSGINYGSLMGQGNALLTPTRQPFW